MRNVYIKKDNINKHSLPLKSTCNIFLQNAEKTETSAPAEGISSVANASTDTQAAANVVSEGSNEVQENGGNKKG